MSELELDKTLLRARLATLWIFMALVGMARAFAASNLTLASGEFPQQPPPGFLLWGAGASLALFAIPILCVTLKDSWNRVANIVLGIAFTVVGIVGTAGGLTLLTASNAHLSLMDAAATVAPATIVYYAYRWPKD